jgi:glucose/arabinose dehydrogenase
VALTRAGRVPDGGPGPRAGRTGSGLAALIAILAVAVTAAVPSGTLAYDPGRVDVVLAEVGSGFANPILVTNTGDGSGRLFVVEQGGRVRTLADGPAGTPFLDVHTRVLSGGERGLLGLAFHPDFETNGKLYVNYTRQPDGATVVDEYRVTTNPDDVDEGLTRRQLLAIAQPYANHNGGNMAFGPDGYLYIGLGDGGSGGDPEERAQNLDSWLGKLLRIDVNGTSAGKAYRVPSTNPYVGRTGIDEIWASGLRNPWRWSFDRRTGDLWIGDVGQGAWEEVDRSTAASGGGRARNYGWDVMEGRHCFEPATGCSKTGKTPPVLEYAHSVSGDDNCSVTGGFVYRGILYTLLEGAYFYADYCSGRIWTVDSRAASPATGVELMNTSLNIVSFGESERGELFIASQDGSIRAIRERTRIPGVAGR